jgi:S-adenosylmethionine/arginine decarboxylase-like enzyme|tara:strand:- start:169 stop:549 length:381 start_codon:yes stop_codon:yes gene_type:complete
MAEVHKHLIIRAETNKTPTDPAWAHQWLTKLVKKIGMKICQGPITAYVNVPGNKGLTGLVVIETSHIALHCWDEDTPGLLQLDVYTCGPLDEQIIFNELKQFDPVCVEYKYLDRKRNLKEIDVNKK